MIELLFTITARAAPNGWYNDEISTEATDSRDSVLALVDHMSGKDR